MTFAFRSVAKSVDLFEDLNPFLPFKSNENAKDTQPHPEDAPVTTTTTTTSTNTEQNSQVSKKKKLQNEDEDPVEVKQVKKQRISLTMKDNNLLPCPICSKSFAADKIEDHLALSDTNLVLERLGLEPQMKKTMGHFAITCVGFNICNSWVGLAATMVIGMEQGGSVTIIYGMMVTLLGLGCSAATMAELASVYPTAGGPYHWTSILAPRNCYRLLVCWPILYCFVLRVLIISSSRFCRVIAAPVSISSGGSRFALL